MTNIANPVSNCDQFYTDADGETFYIDPDEKRFNELMTEANCELLEKLFNRPRLVVDNTVDAGLAGTPQQWR